MFNFFILFLSFNVFVGVGMGETRKVEKLINFALVKSPINKKPVLFLGGVYVGVKMEGTLEIWQK